MAASLPCVASPVGANTEAVVDGFNGFHAVGDFDWERSLERLIISAPLRARLGANGHAHAARRYSMHAYQRQYLALVARLAAAG
jgi:glycosyltransferase involved in cell wall biosynthesis